MQRIAVITAFFAFGTAFASTPVGTWAGRFQIQLPTPSMSLSPQQKAAAAWSMGQTNKGRMFLTIKADHIYAIRTVGLPGDPNKKGTWSQKGNVVTLNETTAGAKPQELTLSADGKTMSLTYPGGLGRLTFSR